MADATNGKPKTELLDELEKGPWPSFVKEIKSAAETSEKAGGLLQQLELSYKEKKGHWKHGGMVGVLGYGANVMAACDDRHCDGIRTGASSQYASKMAEFRSLSPCSCRLGAARL